MSPTDGIMNAENHVKDGFITGKYKKNISHLEYQDAIDAGQSFWRFIGKEYGDALIPNIIYLTKIYKNVDDGFLYVTGQRQKNFSGNGRKYYQEEFADDSNQPGDDGNVMRRSKKEQRFQQVKCQPGWENTLLI
jgi:hypothetical protein